MPRVHHIKKARKDFPASGIKRGDSYYKWSIKTGPAGGQVFRSKTYPKPSQLTLSPFTSELLSIQEEMSGLETGNFETAYDLSSTLDDIIGRIDNLREETQASLDNMPEGLQQGDVGQMMQERIDNLDSWMSDLQGVDLDFNYDEEEPEIVEGDDETEHAHDEWEQGKQEAETEFISNAIDEIQSMDPGL